MWTWNGDYGTGGRLYLYGPSGEVLGEFTASRTDPNNSVRGTEYVYFAGRRVLKIDWEGQPAAMVTDRLGSGRVTHESHPYPSVVPRYHSSSYYPYGETRSGPGSLFATYTGTGNLRYAMNRWYSSQFGRFTTPDPYQASAGLENPQSWNRYANVENDPVNHNDSIGLFPIFCDHVSLHLGRRRRGSRCRVHRDLNRYTKLYGSAAPRICRLHASRWRSSGICQWTCRRHGPGI